jgi:hypothetical protein
MKVHHFLCISRIAGPTFFALCTNTSNSLAKANELQGKELAKNHPKGVIACLLSSSALEHLAWKLWKKGDLHSN